MLRQASNCLLGRAEESREVRQVDDLEACLKKEPGHHVPICEGDHHSGGSDGDWGRQHQQGVEIFHSLLTGEDEGRLRRFVEDRWGSGRHLL